MSLLTDQEKECINELARTTPFTLKDLRDAYLLPQQDLRSIKALKLACKLASSKNTSVIDESWKIIQLQKSCIELEKQTLAYKMNQIKKALVNLWAEIKKVFI